MEIEKEKIDKIFNLLMQILELLPTTPESKELKIGLPTQSVFGISQGFGENPPLYTPYGYAGHFGIDFLTPHGTPIIAVDDGIVSRQGFSKDNGNYIEIQHAWGYSLYLHFKEPALYTLGQSVHKGDIIGHAGNTGKVYSSKPMTDPLRGTHLHFSMKVNGIKNPTFKDWINPAPYFEI